MKKIKINKLIYTLLILALSFLYSNFTRAQFGPNKNIVNIKVYQSFDKVYAGSEFKLAVKTEIGNGWHINSNKPNDDFLIPTKLTIDSVNGFQLEKVIYPPAQNIKLSFSETPLSVWEGEIYIGGLVKTSNTLSPGKYKLIANLEYQSCNNKTCLAPVILKDTINVEVVNKNSAAAEINQGIFSKINLNYSGAQSVTAANDNSITNVLEHSGLILSLLFIFIGGLALNLTPCVYPLIPITIGFFGGQSEGNTRKLFLMGLFFVIGMALTYSVVGVVTALSGAVFGSLMQNPIVIIVIALIFVILSLSMFGLYEIQMPNSLVAKAGGAKGGYYGAFFMGLTMGIVAAPCIGPFVLGLVTFVAAKADPFIGFLMFFVLALGLGLPYLILAVFSGKIKKLPKSGIWMEGVKHVFGFVLLGMAFYFLLPLLPKSISGYVLPVFLIMTAGYLLLFEKIADKVKGFKIFKIAFSIIILGVAIYALIPSEKKSINWKAYSPSIATANIQSSKGTIIDFYADWCIPCKELEASTFSNPKVIAESKDFNAYKANMTKSLSPDVQALRDKYSIVGVPTVLLLNSKGKEVKRITGYVDANEFLKLLKEVD
jgi:thioredoxin:protein disulfide reductase